MKAEEKGNVDTPPDYQNRLKHRHREEKDRTSADHQRLPPITTSPDGNRRIDAEDQH